MKKILLLNYFLLGIDANFAREELEKDDYFGLIAKLKACYPGDSEECMVRIWFVLKLFRNWFFRSALTLSVKPLLSMNIRLRGDHAPDQCIALWEIEQLVPHIVNSLPSLVSNHFLQWTLFVTVNTIPMVLLCTDSVLFAPGQSPVVVIVKMVNTMTTILWLVVIVDILMAPYFLTMGGIAKSTMLFCARKINFMIWVRK